MSTSPSLDVSVRDPQVDDHLRYQTRTWAITNRATYTNDQGYRTIEWCCETLGVEAYLLKEFEAGKPPRWFFTRWMAIGNATVEGTLLTTWIKNHPDQTPTTVVYQGTTYTYKDKTDGMYESDEHGRQHKITWDCWDKSGKINLAIELWQSGEVDVYRGSYVETYELKLIEAPADHPFAQLTGLIKSPHDAMTALWVFLFFFLFLVTAAPFEDILAWTLSLSLMGVALLALVEVPALTTGALGLVIIGMFVYGSFAPLTTALGLTATISLPLLFVFYARWVAHAEEHRSLVLYLAGWTVAMPILLDGLYIYFHYAPSPRTFGELLIAILPAAIAGIAGVILAYFTLSESTSTSDPA